MVANLASVISEEASEQVESVPFDPRSAVFEAPGEIVVADSEDRREDELSLGRQASHRFLTSHGYPPALHGRINLETATAVLGDLVRSGAAGRKQGSLRWSAVLIDGRLVGVTPARLGVVSKADFLGAVSQGAEQAGVDLGDGVTKRYATGPGRFAIDAVWPAVFETEPQVGDVVQFGVRIEHSVSGDHPSRVLTYAHRLACENGMLAPVCLSQSGNRKRIRRGGADPMRLLESTRSMARSAFLGMADRMRGLREAAKMPLSLESAIEDFARRQRLSKAVIRELRAALNNGEHGGSDSVYGLANVLSYVGSHGASGTSRAVPQAILDRLQIASGVQVGTSIHQCPSCQRLLATPAD